MARFIGAESFQSWKATKGSKIAEDNGIDVETEAQEMRDAPYRKGFVDAFRAGKALHRTYEQMTDIVVDEVHRLGRHLGEDESIMNYFLEERLALPIADLNMSSTSAEMMKSRIYQMPIPHTNPNP